MNTLKDGYIVWLRGVSVLMCYYSIALSIVCIVSWLLLLSLCLWQLLNQKKKKWLYCSWVLSNLCVEQCWLGVFCSLRYFSSWVILYLWAYALTWWPIKKLMLNPSIVQVYAYSNFLFWRTKETTKVNYYQIKTLFNAQPIVIIFIEPRMS